MMKKQLARFGRPIVRSRGTLIECVGVRPQSGPDLRALSILLADWVRYVREHISLRDCQPDHEAQIVEELAQQLDDAYQEELQSGLSEQDALRSATRHISDWRALAKDIQDAGITDARWGRTKRPRCERSLRSASSSRNCRTDHQWRPEHPVTESCR